VIGSIALRAEALRWHRSARYAWAWVITPIVLFGLLGSIRFVDRELLRRLAEEDGLFEWIQAAAFLVAASASLGSAALLARRAERLPASLFALLALALLFALGEELAWGQRALGFSTPESLAAVNQKQEVSLHNISAITGWFSLAKLAIGVYGGLGALVLAWLRRRWNTTSIELYVVPLFLASPFLIVVGMHVLRHTVLGGKIPVGYAELEELWLATGMAAFTTHVCLLLRRGRAGAARRGSAKRRTLLLAATLALSLGVTGYALIEWRRDRVPDLLRPATTTADSTHLPERERISFLAVGRQGYGNPWAMEVARAMELSASRTATDLVVLTGDNFYPDGVASVTDGQWQEKFERLYDGPHLLELPFYPVAGNHDHAGHVEAQLAYARERRGSARWRMPGLLHCQDFGRAEGRILVRLVFLDSVLMARKAANRAEGVAFLRDASARAGDPLWHVVVAHSGVRSATERKATRRMLLEDLLPVTQELGVDLILSGNDRFQQVLDLQGEPLHVSTNGGGGKLELELAERSSESVFLAVRPGFARVTADADSLTVELMDRAGEGTYRLVRHP